MQSGEAAWNGASQHAQYTMPMDIHMATPLTYYSCIMDNNAVYAAQQAQLGKIYGGLDPTCRRPEDLGGQTTINSSRPNPRILELRKEKSRDAARSRRGKENREFVELAGMLPLPHAITSQLDKASVIRLTIAYLKLREFAAKGHPKWNEDHEHRLKNQALRSAALAVPAMEDFEKHEGTHILQSLDGFAIALNSDGRFLYISETVSIYLGLSQVELTGSSMFDYVHTSDHAELAEQLGVTLANHQRISPTSATSLSPDVAEGLAVNHGASPAIPDVCYPVTSLMHAKVDRISGKPTWDRAFCIRMKSTLTKRGCHFKSSGYRVVLLMGKLRRMHTEEAPARNPSSVMGFIGLAIALPPPSVHEVRLESDMFVTRLTFDFKVAHCEPKVSELLDYTADEMTGMSLYSLCHGEDVHKLKNTHEDLLNKGQVMSNYYRILNKSGGYSWMQSCATLICNTKNADEQSIICVNYVLSGPQFADIVMDTCQTDSKLGIAIKDDCRCDFIEAGEKCEVHGKKQTEDVGLKLRSFNKEASDHLQRRNENDPTYHQLGHNNEDMRLNHSNYHVTNPTNKDWPFWRPPTLI